MGMPQLVVTAVLIEGVKEVSRFLWSASERISPLALSVGHVADAQAPCSYSG
jgi:hypothetical protein